MGWGATGSFGRYFHLTQAAWVALPFGSSRAPLFEASEQMSEVSCGFDKTGSVNGGCDVRVDDAECLAEARRSRRTVGWWIDSC